MENFVVSARKYRPQTFDDVVGQRSLTDTLKRAIMTHKLASAYLFCGPRGVGKTTCARIFAKAINCLNPKPDGEACNECESCRSFNEGRSMNIQELNAAANNSVDDIRQIIDQVRTPPQLGKYKVIILDEVHMLSASASNALLKTLEEPPSYVIFILATTEKQKIMPTILSRCQIFDFNRMEVDDIVGNLKNVASHENIQYEENALNLIAQKADGGMRDALSIFDQVTNYSGGNITQDSVLQCLNMLDYDAYFKMTDLLLDHRVGDSLLLLNDIIGKGFDGCVFIGGLASHFRNLLVSRDASTLPLLDVSKNVREQYSRQAGRCKVKFLYRAIKICDACSNGYRDSYNKRLSVELALIETAQAAEDDEGSGLRPETTLKPLFKDTNPAATGSAASKTVIKNKTGNSVPPAKPGAAATSHPASTLSGSGTTPAAAKKVVTHTPRINLGGILGGTVREPKPAFNASGGRAQTSVAVPAATAAPAEEITTAELPFSETHAEYACKVFAEKLQGENPSVAARLQGVDLLIENKTHIVIIVGNEMAKKYVSPYVNALQDHLRKELQNRLVSVEIRIATAKQRARILTPQEMFEKLLEENPAVSKMKSDLDLQVEY